MLQLSLAQVRANAGRLIATGLAIVIAVGFIVATLVLNATSRSTIYGAVAQRYLVSDAVVTLTPPADPPAVDPGAQVADPDRTVDGVLAEVRALKDVSGADVDRTADVQLTVPGRGGRTYATVQSVATAPSLRWEHLLGGRLPATRGEVAVAGQAGAPVGSTVTIAHPAAGSAAGSDAGDDAPLVTEQARVVGVVDQRGDPRAAGVIRVFATESQTRAYGASGWTTIRVKAAPGVAPAHLVLELSGLTRTVAGLDVLVQDRQNAADDAVGGYTGDASSLTIVLLIFAGVALVVAALVIANTFAVLVAQRTRELALLRCVGASGHQVRRGVLIESLLIGLASSAAGVAGGIAVAAGLVQLAQHSDVPIPVQGLTVPLSAVLIGLVIGTVTTVAAAFVPAGRATRVSPLAALRPVDAPVLRSRAGLLRLGSGLLLLVLGGAVLGAGAIRGVLPIGFLGGVLSFLGVLLLARHVVPLVAGRAGRLTARFGGVPGELASLNAVRNPQRTAATALALLIGVTLTTTMVVGAATTRTSASAVLDDHFPADVVVHGSGLDPLPASLAGRLQAVEGVQGTLDIYGTEITGPGDLSWTVQAFADGQQVLRSAALGPLPKGTLEMPDDSWGQAGTRVPVKAGAVQRMFTVRINPDATGPRVGLADLRSLAPAAGVQQVAVRLTEQAQRSPGGAVGEITEVAGQTDAGSYVEGPAQERAAFDKLLDIMLLIVTALLMVAVIIAIIGVGNTIALSVIERRQENGLVRALGLTRRQLRLTLLWEAALIAGVASVIGVVLGVVYGITGTASVLAREADGLSVSIPWLQVALIVVVATAAGALASVLPARRAARVSPVAAMAV